MRISPGLCANEMARALAKRGYFFKSGLNASTGLHEVVDNSRKNIESD